MGKRINHGANTILRSYNFMTSPRKNMINHMLSTPSKITTMSSHSQYRVCNVGVESGSPKRNEYQGSVKRYGWSKKQVQTTDLPNYSGKTPGTTSPARSIISDDSGQSGHGDLSPSPTLEPEQDCVVMAPTAVVHKVVTINTGQTMKSVFQPETNSYSLVRKPAPRTEIRT